MAKKPDDELDFDLIFNQDITQKNIELKLAESKKKNQTIVFCAIFIFLAFFGIRYIIGQNNQDYVDGNVLKIAAGGTLTQERYSLANPWKNASFMGQVLFSTLFETDATFTYIEPLLANNLDVSPDGLTYTITLNDGLKWSDGQPLTADDVIFSFESFLLNSDVNVNMATAFQKISGCEDWRAGKTDSLTGISAEGNVITIKLDSKYNTFGLMLTQFAPLPKHILESQNPETITEIHDFFTNENPVCSGMFLSEGINDEFNIVLSQNPHYFGTQTEIEQIIAYWDWKNMEVDYFGTTDITQMVTYRSLRNYSEFDVDVFFYRYFIFNSEGGEHANDLKIRQAINHAIDIERLFEDIYLSAGSIVHGGNTNFANELYSYDPAKSIELLREANYSSAEPFVIAYYYSDANSRIFLEKVAEYLEAVGINVELARLSSAELYTDPTYDMMLKGLSSFNSEDWYNEYLSTNTNISALIGDAGYDELVNSMTSAVSVEEFRSYMVALVELEQSQLNKLPLFTLNQCVYINTSRIQLPENMQFGNIRYTSDLRLDEWHIKKS